MKLLKILSAAAVGLLALLPISLNAQSVAAGTVKVIKVTGTAQLDNAALKNGDIFAQGKTVKTGANSRVLVRFSNGAAVSVRENTEIKLTTFQQEPITAVKVATHEQIKSEPSKSNTQLNLNYGKIIARAHQMQAKGSKFEINTPAGAAGIRGSVAVISFVPSTGTMTISSLIGTISALATGQTLPTLLRQGTSVSFIFTLNATTGAVTSVSVQVDLPIDDPDLLTLLSEIGLGGFDQVDSSVISPSDIKIVLPFTPITP